MAQTFPLQMTATVYNDGTIRIFPDEVQSSILHQALGTNKHRGSMYYDTKTKTLCFDPYPQGEAKTKLVREKKQVGTYTHVERLKNTMRILTSLPHNMTPSTASLLYMDDALKVAEQLRTNLYRPEGSAETHSSQNSESTLAQKQEGGVAA